MQRWLVLLGSVATAMYDDGPAPTRFNNVKYVTNATTLPNTAR